MGKGKKTHEGNESHDSKETGHENPDSRVNSQAISEYSNDKESISSALDSTASKSMSNDDKNEVEADGNESDKVKDNTEGKKTHEGNESHDSKETGHENPDSRVNSQAISEYSNDKESISSALDSTASKSLSNDDKNEVEADGNETDKVKDNTEVTGSKNIQGEEEEQRDFSEFKGTVYQKNGHWGAQLYFNGDRIWLGTFKNRKEAARAYGIANFKFKGQHGQIKFSEAEKLFHDSLTHAQFVNLIKEHIYDRELQKWCNAHHSPNQVVSGNAGEMEENMIPEGPMIDRQYLFEKQMTASDVGTLNRLVIPKQHAERHFPKERLVVESETFLTVVDTSDSSEWQFRFSYWKSSRSYVLTKGWRKFVKAKDLKGGNVVSFSRDIEMPNNKFYITVHASQTLMSNNCVQLEERGSASQSSISVSTKSICEPKELVKSDEKRRVDENTHEKTSNHFHGSAQLGKRKAMEDESEIKSEDVIKLFGVEIGRRGKKLKADGVEIDPKGKLI